MVFEDKFSLDENADSLRGFSMTFDEDCPFVFKGSVAELKEIRKKEEETGVSQFRFKGHVWAVMEHDDGRVEKFDLGENIVVATASVMVARLLADKTDIDWGLKYLALGSGQSVWDTTGTPPATTSDTKIVNEIARKTFMSVSFIDPVTGAVSADPTHIVDYTAKFEQTEAVGPIRSLGLVSGDCGPIPVDYANGGRNTDTYFNARNCAVIHKPATSSITFTWRITT